jgi:hypothetical protein
VKFHDVALRLFARLQKVDSEERPSIPPVGKTGPLLKLGSEKGLLGNDVWRTREFELPSELGASLWLYYKPPGAGGKLHAVPLGPQLLSVALVHANDPARADRYKSVYSTKDKHTAVTAAGEAMQGVVGKANCIELVYGQEVGALPGTV